MRYLRMLSNSLVAAVLGTAYVLTIVLHLNPALPFDPAHLGSLAATVGLYYVFHLTVIGYVLLVFRQLFAREVFSPAWVSVDVLGWMSAVAATGGAVLMWRNLWTFALVLDSATAEALDRSGFVVAIAAGLCAALALLRRRMPHARRTWAFFLVVVTASSVAVPLALRGRGTAPLLEARPIDVSPDPARSERSSRVTVIAIDAASLNLITSATAEGRLPNFGRILDAGAVRHLATLHPTSAETVWAAVATGKLPQKNGVRSAGIYQMAGGGGALQLLPDYCFAHGLVRFGFLVEEPLTSATFRTRTLWSILSMEGVSVGVVGWPLMQPAPVVRGFVVSDTFHRAALMSSGIADPSALSPPELQAQAAAALDRVMAEAVPVVTPSLPGIDAQQESSTRTDRIYDAIAHALTLVQPPQVMLTRYQSLDLMGHYYLRYATPVEFGDVTDEERRSFGPVLERQYGVVDEVIGRAMAALAPDDLLLVVSGYGMEPLGVGKRIVERLIGDPDISGTHEMAPDGFLIAYGTSVARGPGQARASVVDVVPTILYFLGLPIGRDMDGYARTDLFQRTFTDERPITYIPTYDR